jgi:glucose-1-phosphate thymidylyltransferase
VIKNDSASRLRKDVKVEGRVRIGGKCKIKNSSLRGPSVIGDGVVIEDSFIGPYSSIGDDCQIREAKLENVILMKEVQIINPGKSLDSCLIGKESIINGNRRASNGIELFVGNQCVIKL